MNSKIIRFLAVFIAFASCGFAFAQESNSNKKERLVLTVEDAVSYALKNNQSLKSAAIDLEIKKRANSNSWNTFLPTVGVSGTAARTTDIDSTLQSANGSLQMMNLIGVLHPEAKIPISSLYNDEEKFHWAVVGNVGVSWAFNLAMVSQIQIAKKQYESGLISYDTSCTKMEMNIRKLFYGLLIQQENLKINKDSLANAKARYEQAEINYRNGLTPELQVLNSQVTYENKKPDVLKAENQLNQSFDTFAFLLGLPYGTKIELKGDINPEDVVVDASELVNDYISSSNEILSMRKTIEIAKLGLNAKKLSVFTPSLAVNYSYNPLFYSFGEWKSGSDISDNGSLSLTVAFSDVLSWLPWSSASQGIKDLKQQIVQAELGYEQLVNNAEVEIHKLVDNLEVAKVNIQSMEANVALAQKAYSSTLRAFNNGTQEWLSVRESDASLQQARLGLMNEKFNYISAVLDLEEKLNTKLLK
jgi:outer membrane protein TolC